MGKIRLTVTWTESEPDGIYETAEVASACDIETPDGAVVLADYWDNPVTEHVFSGVTRCRMFVVVRDRDVSMFGPYRGSTSEHHEWTVWPTAEPRPAWNSGVLDQRGQSWLRSYEDYGMDPAVGQREP
jgi:hypothetical protein